MKYAISARQPKDMLNKADEIIIDYKDIDYLFDLIELFPDKKYILKLPYGEDINWTTVDNFNKLCNLEVALMSLNDINRCKEHNIKFFWGYEIISYYDLKRLVDLGVSQVLLGNELYFDVKNIKEHFNTPIRLIANKCFDSYLPAQEGVCGTYVRPEDIDTYGKYVDTIEFYYKDLHQEKVLFKIYAEDKKWPGNLNLILANLNVDIDNRGLPDEFGSVRMICQQKCMKGRRCAFCYTAMKFARTVDFYRPKDFDVLK